MYDLNWYKLPLDHRACKGGEEGVNGDEYKGGEFLPFYVPRPVMPQVDECDLTALIEFVTFRGCETKEGKTDPDELHFHQRVDFDKCKKMKKETLKKPVLISLDMFVLDGNHRTMEHKLLGTEVPYIMLCKPFEEAIGLLMAFPGTYEYCNGDDGKERD